MSNLRKRLLTAGLTCLPLTLTGVAHADALYPPKGVPVDGGAFRIFPTADLLFVYDDNVYKIPTNTIASWYFITRPELRLASQWGRHELDLYAGTEVFNYFGTSGTSSEDQTNWNVGGNGRYDIFSGIDFVGDGSFQILHEPRVSPDQPTFAKKPTPYARTKLDAALEYHPYHFSATLGGSFERLDYSPTQLIVSSPPFGLDNSDRNRDDWNAFTKLGYEFSPGYAVFMRANYDTRGFDLHNELRSAVGLTPGIHRASNGFSVDAGLDMEVTHLIVGKLYGGYLEQYYHDPRLQHLVSGFDFGAGLTWTPTALWTVKLDAAHVVNDTTLIGASAENDQQVELTADLNALPYLIIEGKAGYLDSDFPGASGVNANRHDQYYNAGLSAKYLINEYAAIKAGYQYERRDSNIGKSNFSDNEFTIGLVLQE